MIHIAKVIVSFPGTKWAEEKQTVLIYTPQFDPSREEYEGEVPLGVILCEEGSVKVWSLMGDDIDPHSELEYQFVKYDEQRGFVILAVLSSWGDASTRFDNLFSNVRQEENDLAFLIIPTKRSSSRVEAWALMPTDRDAVKMYGASASLEHLERLIKAVKH